MVGRGEALVGIAFSRISLLRFDYAWRGSTHIKPSKLVKCLAALK